MKKLSIILITVISSLFGCTTSVDKNTIELIFEFTTGKEVIKKPLICKTKGDSFYFYFGLPTTEINKVDVKNLKMIRVKRNDSLIANAKPIEVLSSNLPDSDSFFSVNNYRNTIGDYINDNITWTIIQDNPRNENKLSKVLEGVVLDKCAW